MPTSSPPAKDDQRFERAPLTPRITLKSPPQRRRTYGLCAHCAQPVKFGDEYLRLYRRAWHLDCALAATDAGSAVSAVSALSR